MPKDDATLSAASVGYPLRTMFCWLSPDAWLEWLDRDRDDVEVKTNHPLLREFLVFADHPIDAMCAPVVPLMGENRGDGTRCIEKRVEVAYGRTAYRVFCRYG
jgi:hypothetical protein